MKGKLTLIFICICVLAAAQITNPFDLVPRLDTVVQGPLDVQELKDQGEDSGNPFDVVTPPPGVTAPTPAISPVVTNPPDEITTNPYRTFLIITSIVDFVLLTILVLLFRSYFDRVYNGFLNDNLLGQLYRERAAGLGIPFLMMYLLYFFNLGWLIFLTLKHYNVNLVPSNTYFLSLTIVGVTVVTFARHLVLRFIAFTFPVTGEAKLYSFLINIFNIIVGVALWPINLLAALGPSNFVTAFIFLGFVVLILIYLFRSIRGLLIANRYLTFYKFHFLLYICTIEIVPLVVLYKIISIYL